MTNWNSRFMRLAEEVGTWSKDPSSHIGAVIVRPNKTIASIGYNGFARGVRDLDDRLEAREQKLLFMIHAELNAILSAREPLDKCAIYITPFHPCSTCAAAIIQSGISQVIIPLQAVPERWAANVQTASDMLFEAGVSVARLSDSDLRQHA